MGQGEDIHHGKYSPSSSRLFVFAAGDGTLMLSINILPLDVGQSTSTRRSPCAGISSSQ